MPSLPARIRRQVNSARYVEGSGNLSLYFAAFCGTSHEVCKKKKKSL